MAAAAPTPSHPGSSATDTVAVAQSPPVGPSTTDMTAVAPSSPPATIQVGNLAAIYLTPRALSSQGIHPTILEALPQITSAPETGTWFAVTTGRYTGVYQEWYVSSFLLS